jgi:SnoaL-like domain
VDAPDSALLPDQELLKAAREGDSRAFDRLIAADARFTMPPLPAWFDGRDDIGRFLAERIFATSWRMVPVRANAQLAFAGYRENEDRTRFQLAGLNVVTLHGDRIAEITSFLDPGMFERFGLPEELAG